MLFSKCVIAPLLALTSLVVGQVVVTVTNTVTVVTVTVPPPSTSTSIVIVTVTGKPTGASTSTATVTVTATPPPATTAAVCPLGLGGSCGLWNPAPGGCRSCAAGLTCRSVMWSSSRCESKTASVITITSTIYRERD